MKKNTVVFNYFETLIKRCQHITPTDRQQTPLYTGKYSRFLQTSLLKQSGRAGQILLRSIIRSWRCEDDIFMSSYQDIVYQVQSRQKLTRRGTHKRAHSCHVNIDTRTFSHKKVVLEISADASEPVLGTSFGCT